MSEKRFMEIGSLAQLEEMSATSKAVWVLFYRGSCGQKETCSCAKNVLEQWNEFVKTYAKNCIQFGVVDCDSTVFGEFGQICSIKSCLAVVHFNGSPVQARQFLTFKYFDEIEWSVKASLDNISCSP